MVLKRSLKTHRELYRETLSNHNAPAKEDEDVEEEDAEIQTPVAHLDRTTHKPPNPPTLPTEILKAPTPMPRETDRPTSIQTRPTLATNTRSGFAANPALYVSANALQYLGNIPSWYYFCRPQSMTFHDLTTTLTPSYDLCPLLGLGHKFIPIPQYSNGPREVLRQFDRTTNQHNTNANPETETDTDRQYNHKMYVPSDWDPPRFTYPAIVQRRLNNFCNEILEEFVRRRGRSNLLPHQRRALQWAQTKDNFVIALTDKIWAFASLKNVNIYIEFVLCSQMSTPTLAFLMRKPYLLPLQFKLKF
ncbi:unnamed protein product [Cylindrotheca closterium]|uniref:Uncharacterized protein n=1 Tax=Cylindrotheca closterium TaxID=2856 RepID=A0AAD2G4N2_9STRA|nr:unnamed protein product [Cylindrotheca closterium]